MGIDPAKATIFLQSEIPYSSLVEQMSVHRSPVFDLARRSDVAGAFERLWEEILARMGDAESHDIWKHGTREALDEIVRRDPHAGNAT